MSYKVLLVEDEPSVQDVVRRMLKSSNFEVLCADNPSEAISLYDFQSSEIFLLITDIIMPGMNGWDLYNKIKQNNPNIEVIFMSGYGQGNAIVKKVFESGYTFLQKPFSFKELAGLIKEKINQTPGHEIEI